MNRKAVLIIAVIAIAWLGLSWFTGHLARGQLQAWNEQVQADFPLVKVAERRVQGGLFTSTEEVVYELNTELLRGIFEQAETQTHDALDAGEDEAPRFTVRNHIQHGPLPGFRSLGLARVETEAVLGENVRRTLLESIGVDKPVQVVTHLGFIGGGWTTVESPAFEYTDEDSGQRVAWQGVQARFEFTRNLDRFSGAASAPGVQVFMRDEATDAAPDETRDEVAGQFTVGEMRFETDLERAFGPVYAGKASFSIAEIAGSGPRMDGGLSLKDMRYEVDVTTEQDYFDMLIRMGVGAVAVDQMDIRDAHYDLSLRHLHGPTSAELSDRMSELYFASVGGDPMAMIGMVGLFAQHGPTLLEHEPELVLDRITFTLPEGGASISGRVRLKDFERGDLMAGGPALLSKLDVVMDIWLDQGLLEKDWSAAVPQPAAAAEDGTGAGPAAGPTRIEGMQAQIALMAEQGYVKRNGDRLESRVEFRDGTLTVNGKPMGPAAGGGL
jgi:uncharacterized protein YdgA (DUF945 family)